MKLKYIIAALLVAVTSVSCNKFLDLSDPDAVTVGNFYQTESDIQQSVYGAYAQLKNGYICGTSQWYLEECKANMLFYPDTGVNAGENASFDNASVVSTNQFVASAWNAYYVCIKRANNVLKHLDDVTYANADTKAIYEAEMRFLRAFCYYRLVCHFGAVPLVLETLENLDAIKAANVRVDKEQIYQAIFDDCKAAAASPLPNLQNKANCGRASKAAVYTLWGKALLQMATDPDFSAQKASLSGNAITQLQAAWAVKPFSDFTALPVEDAFNLENQDSAPENIFQTVYISGSTTANSSFNTQFRPTDIDDPTKEVNPKKSSGSFFMRENYCEALYDEQGDLRFQKLIGHGLRNKIPFYYTVKYADMNESGYYGCNFIVFRYADVALMLAEANYHAGKAADALTWLNMVRKRAGLGNSTASGTALRDAIYHERNREFAYEGKIWSDMKRGYSKSEIRDIMHGLNVTMYSDTHYLLPIPHAQIILGLGPQNPGYQD